MISWQYYPKSKAIPDHLFKVTEVFEQHYSAIDSPNHTLNSNGVLSVLADTLLNIGFKVEKGARIEDKIQVPVLFGREGKFEKSFHVDGYQVGTRTVLEVEAGRAVTNYQFLKDLFEACMMHDVDYLVIAVRKKYRTQSDFETVVTHFDALYASGRLTLPLKGILIIGY